MLRLRSNSLRVRLTASYALFFTILLTFLSLGFRQFLAQSLDSQIRAALDQDFAALKGYFRIEKGSLHWYIDHDDPDEAALQGRLHRVFFVADARGTELDVSDIYKTLQPDADTKDEIRAVVNGKLTVWREEVDPKGEHYLIRASYDNDETLDRTYYYVAIGRSLKDNRKILRSFTWLSLGVIPLIALGGCVLGWIYVGRALSPVMDIAQAAQHISGSNLSMRIPTRRSNDELDYLIETFNRMIERLELSFNQIRQFSIDVSHELRTPITVIRGQLEVALFTARTEEQYREAIMDSLHDIERLSGIVRALLLLSQAETGQVLLQRSHVDMNELVFDVVDQFQIPAEGAQVRLSAEGFAGDCFLEADRVQIERMISNLLSNAVKFTPPGGEVRVCLRERDGGVEIEVCDTGTGISPEHLPHIFDRFYRVSAPSAESSPERGLGLGLSFVAWIAKAHGGSVDVRSTFGEGTTFTIHLPRQAPASPAAPSADSAETAGLKQV
jgi:heavy metal sensor kinase